MTSTYRFYTSLTIGDGLSKKTAFRSKLCNYIVNDGTQDLWDWYNPARQHRFCLALCNSSLHATIVTDADIIALSPELADISAVNVWLDSIVDPMSFADIEKGGVPVHWAVGTTTTWRQLWRFVAAWHYVSQRFSGENDNHGLTFLKANLDHTVSSVPHTTRTRIASWMTNKGLDTSWITDTTPVRDIVSFIIQNADFPIMNHGPVSF